MQRDLLGAREERELGVEVGDDAPLGEAVHVADETALVTLIHEREVRSGALLLRLEERPERATADDVVVRLGHLGRERDGCGLCVGFGGFGVEAIALVVGSEATEEIDLVRDGERQGHRARVDRAHTGADGTPDLRAGDRRHRGHARSAALVGERPRRTDPSEARAHRGARFERSLNERRELGIAIGAERARECGRVFETWRLRVTRRARGLDRRSRQTRACVVEGRGAAGQREHDEEHGRVPKSEHGPER